MINLKTRNNKIITKLAKYAFPVYLFHQVPAFYPILWNTVYRREYWSLNHYFIWPLFVFFSLFIVVMCIEKVREILFEPLWNKNKLVKLFNSFLESVYS